MVCDAHALAVFLRPKDDEEGIKLLQVQFAIFDFGGLRARTVGRFRDGGNSVFMGTLWLIVLVLIVIAFVLGLQLRKLAGQRPPAELSKYTCNTLLLGDVGAMAPLVFFLFETLSCDTCNGFKGNQCRNTTLTATFLSTYTVIILVFIMSKKQCSWKREKRD